MSERCASARLTAAMVAALSVVGAACGTTPSTTKQGSVTTTTTTTTTSIGASTPSLPPGGKPDAGCENLGLDARTRADLVRAFGHQGGTIERSGRNFVGRCGTDRYAYAAVTPPAGLTVEQGIAYQDQPTIFAASQNSEWRVVTDTGGAACFWPEQPIPKALMMDIWQFPAC